MSNKTNQSVLVNDTSSYYLKQYAALQFPGSVDNFGTKTPIHLLQQQEESEHSVSLQNEGWESPRFQRWDDRPTIMVFFLSTNIIVM